MITPEKFAERVGRPPVDDDLERCNCTEAGDIGHYLCGWDEETDLPVFMSFSVQAQEKNGCDTIVMRRLREERRPRNFYEPPFFNFITSGEFWRCHHGTTRFTDEGGCAECAAERPDLVEALDGNDD